MKACLVTHGIEDIGFDNEYKKPSTHMLHRILCDYMEDLGVSEIFTSAAWGPENIFTWAADALNIKIFLIVPCQDFNRFFPIDHKEWFKKNVERAVSLTVVGDNGWNLQKADAAIDRIIKSSDIVFALWNKKGSPPPGFELAKALDKEIIIINPKELTNETITVKTDKKECLEIKVRTS